MNAYRSISMLLSILAVLTFTGCGKSEPENAANTSPSSSAAEPKYNDNLDHQAFERKSADVCIRKELALRKKEHPTSGNVAEVDEALTKLCTCIAKEESKHLTKQEAKKFVQENEYPMSLMIKAGQAEEICSKK